MQNIIKNILTDVKVELSAEFDQNFTRKAFFDKKWKDRKRQGKGTLLVATGKLRRSIRAKTFNTSVTWTSSEPYAGIHNEGGEITVTKKMKRFFWAKYYELGGKIKYKKNGQPSPKFMCILPLVTSLSVFSVVSVAVEFVAVLSCFTSVLTSVCSFISHLGIKIKQVYFLYTQFVLYLYCYA